MFVAGQLCDKCKLEIGHESYVVLQDNISRHLHKFHFRCQPKASDVQRHYGLQAEGLVTDMKGLNLGGI